MVISLELYRAKKAEQASIPKAAIDLRVEQQALDALLKLTAEQRGVLDRHFGLSAAKPDYSIENNNGGSGNLLAESLRALRKSSVVPENSAKTKLRLVTS